jgi:hypothetical protein
MVAMEPLNLFHIPFKVSKFANFATLPSVEAKAAGPPSRPTAWPFGKKQVWGGWQTPCPGGSQNQSVGAPEQ